MDGTKGVCRCCGSKVRRDKLRVVEWEVRIRGLRRE